MSAPVLSWLFTAQGKPRKAFLVRQFSPCTNPLSTRRRQVASAQLEHKNKDPYTQPSEPILFPKLRIYFADFPYLLMFYGPVVGELGGLKGFEGSKYRWLVNSFCLEVVWLVNSFAVASLVNSCVRQAGW